MENDESEEIGEEIRVADHDEECTAKDNNVKGKNKARKKTEKERQAGKEAGQESGRKNAKERRKAGRQEQQQAEKRRGRTAGRSKWLTIQQDLGSKKYQYNIAEQSLS